MEGHLRLTDQSHCFHQIYLIPQILLKSRLLIGRELQMLASDWSRGSVENDERGTPLRYGGTFEIDRSISFVPDTLRRLDPYGGTFEIERSISNLPSVLSLEGHLRLTGQSHLSLPHLGGWTPMEGHLRLTSQSHLSLPHLGGWTPMGDI